MSQPFRQRRLLFSNFLRQKSPNSSRNAPISLRLAAPIRRIHRQQFFHAPRRKYSIRPALKIQHRHKSNRSFFRIRFAFHTLQNPLQHAHILTESRPQEFSVRASAEPVHVKNLWWMRNAHAHVQPVPEIIRHVISAEGKHRHRIAPRHANFSRRRRSCFRSHPRANKNSVLPVERLRRPAEPILRAVHQIKMPISARLPDLPIARKYWAIAKQARCIAHSDAPPAHSPDRRLSSLPVQQCRRRGNFHCLPTTVHRRESSPHL